MGAESAEGYSSNLLQQYDSTGDASAVAAVLRRRLVDLSLLAELALYHSSFLGWAPRGDGSGKQKWDQCECLLFRFGWAVSLFIVTVL